MTEQGVAGEPLCLPCAVKAGGIAGALTVLTLGVGRVPAVQRFAGRMAATLAESRVGLWAKALPGRMRVALRTTLARQRQHAMLRQNQGFNVSPTAWDQYPTIGRNGTYLSDQRAITDAIGPLPSTSHTMTISLTQATKLESAMGLEPASFGGSLKLRRVDGIRDMAPRSPLEGNRFFLGGGKHLPGGGPELVVNSIPTEDGDGVTTIMHIFVK